MHAHAHTQMAAWKEDIAATAEAGSADALAGLKQRIAGAAGGGVTAGNLADTFDSLFSSPGLGAQLVAYAAVGAGSRIWVGALILLPA